MLSGCHDGRVYSRCYVKRARLRWWSFVRGCHEMVGVLSYLSVCSSTLGASVCAELSCMGARDVCADYGGGGAVTKGCEGVRPWAVEKSQKISHARLKWRPPLSEESRFRGGGWQSHSGGGTLNPYVSEIIIFVRKKNYDED
jgi:hypothetical protein